MKIGQTAATPNIASVGSAATSARAPQDGGRTGSAGRAEGSESSTVALSSTARALLDGADGSFDAQKVERVRQSISDGTYTINADKIADKLIANAQDVLGKAGQAR